MKYQSLKGRQGSRFNEHLTCVFVCECTFTELSQVQKGTTPCRLIFTSASLPANASQGTPVIYVSQEVLDDSSERVFTWGGTVGVTTCDREIRLRETTLMNFSLLLPCEALFAQLVNVGVSLPWKIRLWCLIQTSRVNHSRVDKWSNNGL